MMLFPLFKNQIFDPIENNRGFYGYCDHLMPRKSFRKQAQEANCRKARISREIRRQEECKKLRIPSNGLQFAFSIIIYGLTFQSVSLCLLQNNILPPSKSTYYHLIDLVIIEIIKLAKESMDYYKSKMTEKTIISFDGSWDHKRNGRHCIVDVIDQNQKKIIDIEYVQKSTKSCPTEYNGSSNNMETYAIRKIIQRLRTDSRIVAYCHDNDSTARKIIKDEWGIEEMLDTNHSIKSFERYFTKFNKLSKNKLNDLHNHLLRFLNHLIYMPSSPSQKVKLWENAIEHYKGNHQNCLPHKASNYIWKFNNDNEALLYLEQFLKQTSFILLKCNPPYSTQLNECYHAIKSHYLNKEVAWKKTAFARLCCSILDFNGVENWRFELRKRLKLPELHPYVISRINEVEKERLSILKQRRSYDYQLKERTRRREIKKKEQKKDKSEYVGHPLKKIYD